MVLGKHPIIASSFLFFFPYFTLFLFFLLLADQLFFPLSLSLFSEWWWRSMRIIVAYRWGEGGHRSEIWTRRKGGKMEGRTRSRTSTFFFLPSNRNLSCLSDSWSTSFSTFVLFRRFTIALSRVCTWTAISMCLASLNVNTEEESSDEIGGMIERTSLDLLIVMERYLTYCHISWFLGCQLYSRKLSSGSVTLGNERVIRLTFRLVNGV